MRWSTILRRAALLAATCAAAGCGGGDGGGGTGPNGSLSLLVLPASLTIPRGAFSIVTATVNRGGGFTGDVTITVDGAPAGVTTTIPVGSTSGGITSVAISLTVNVSAAEGNYPLTIRARGSGVPDATAPLALTIGGAGTGTGNVTLDLSGCTPLNRVLWVAGQDGTNPWTRLTGANEVYRFNVASTKGGVAWVTDNFANAQTLHVYYASQSQLRDAPITPCRAPGTRIVTGSFTGLRTNEFAIASMGGGITSASAAAPSFTLVGVRPGAHDFVAYRFGGLDARALRAVIRRDQDPAASSVAPIPLDSASAEAFATEPARLTVAGANADENVTAYLTYLTGASCDVAQFGDVGLATARIDTILGVPAARQRPTDFHQLGVTTSNENLFVTMEGTQVPGLRSANPGRTVRLFYHTNSDKTVTLGAPLPQPTVTVLPGPYKRLQAVVTLPLEYLTSATLEYGTLTNGPQVSLTATTAWLGGAGATLIVPDFSSVAGWNNAWAPSASTQYPWSVTGTGTNLTTTQCVEGGFIRTARVVGSM